MGNVVAVRNAIARNCGDCLTLVNSHYGTLRMTPLMFCAAGARAVGKVFFPAAATPTADHVGVSKLLVAAGARLEARDVAGFTAFAQATSMPASRASLAVADYLLREGANVQPTDRCGRTPLVQFGSGSPPRDLVLWSTEGVPAAVALLLEAGADAGFTAERTPPRDDFLAALTKIAPQFLKSQGLPADEAHVKSVLDEYLLMRRFSTPCTSVLHRVSKYADIDPNCAAMKRAINECQVRGRVGAGRTLEGYPVRIFGLTKAPELNGVVVLECGAFDPVTCRYAMCIPQPGGSGTRLIAVRSLNVEAADRRAAVMLTCAACSANLAERFSCGGCHRVRYCSAACQRVQWKQGHKKDCRADQRQYTTVTLQPPHQSEVGTNLTLHNSNGPFNLRFWDVSTMDAMCGHARVIKASAAHGNDADAHPLYLYDEPREFAARVPTSDPAHAILLDQIRSAPGCGGIKAYFTATFSRRSHDPCIAAKEAAGVLPPHFPVDVSINLKPLAHQPWI